MFMLFVGFALYRKGWKRDPPRDPPRDPGRDPIVVFREAKCFGTSRNVVPMVPSFGM